MKKNFTLFALLILSFSAFGQDYYFSHTTRTYTPLVGSTSLNGASTWDDPYFEIPIGFNFTFYNITNDTIFVDWNFYGGVLAPDTTTQTPRPILVAIGADLIDRGIDSAVSISNISYKLDGVAGSRILKIEYDNVGFYNEFSDSSSTNNHISFQVWLYEGSNTIEIHYGPSNITNPTLVYDNFNGPIIGLVRDYNYNDDVFTSGIMLEGNPASPSDTITNEFTALGGTPPNGVVYRFSKTPITGLGSQPFTGNQRLYPNPFEHSFTIEAAEEQIELVEVYNLAGQLMHTQTVSANRTTVNIAVAPGIYFANITFANGQKLVQKVVKH